MSLDPREASLAGISRLLAESLDLPVVTRRIAETVRELFHVHTAVLVTVDAGGGILGIGGAGPLPPVPFRLRRGSTLASRAIQDGVPYRTQDILNDPRVNPRPEDREVIARSGHRAVMTVPLLSRGRVIGALSMGDQVGRVFEDEEVRLAEAFAAQAAIALENARLYNEAQTVLAVGRVIAGVSDVAEALRLVCRELARVTGAGTVSAHLDDPVRHALIPTAAYHVPKDVLEAIQAAPLPVLPPEEFPAGLRRGEVVWSDNVGTDPQFTPMFFKRFPHRSGIVVPLVADGGVKGGVYLVWWTERYRPDDAMLQLLKAIGQQIGPLLKNAELVTRLESTAMRLRTLAHTNQVVSSSLDMQSVLGEIARSAAALMNAPVVSFWTVDEARQTVRIETFSDPELSEGFPARELTFGTGAAGWIAEHRAPLAIDDVTQDERFVMRDWWLARGYRSLYGLPILLEGELLGVLALLSRDPLELSPSDRELLGSFVTQAALAIRNARLFQEAEIRRRMAEAAKERYRLLFERNLAGVLRTAADGRMLECNDAFARIVGCASPAEVLGRNILEFWVDPAARQAMIERLGRDHRLTNETVELRRADGSQCSVLVNLTMTGAGADATIEGIGLDITDHQRAEQAERDVQALRSIASLANAAAHEINNPLAVIFGNLDMMKPRVASDTVLANRVERALVAAQKIAESVAAMRNVTKIQTAAPQADIPERLDLRRSGSS